MPKISKSQKKSTKRLSKQERLKLMKYEQAKKRSSMFKSSIVTYLLACVFFVLSLLFNGQFVDLDFGDSTGAKVGLVLLKALPVILFCFFLLISVGNFQEMRGYIASWKEITAIVVITLLMGASGGWEFFTVFLGVAFIFSYVYFLQAKAEQE